MKTEQLIEKVDDVLKKVFSRVELKEPYYAMLRGLQRDIYIHQNRKKLAQSYKKGGMTIRSIAKKLGYENPGSVTALLKD